MHRLGIFFLITLLPNLSYAQPKEGVIGQKAFDYFVQKIDKVNGFDLIDCRLFFSGNVKDPRHCFLPMQLACLISEYEDMIDLWIKEEQMFDQMIIDTSPFAFKEIVLDYPIVYQEQMDDCNEHLTDYHLILSNAFSINGIEYVCIVLLPYNHEASVNYYFVEFNPSGDPVEIYTTSLDICYVE